MGISLLEKHAIAPSAARLCSVACSGTELLIRRLKWFYEQACIPCFFYALQSGTWQTNIHVEVVPDVDVCSLTILQPTPELASQKRPQGFTQRSPAQVLPITDNKRFGWVASIILQSIDHKRVHPALSKHRYSGLD